MTSQLWKQTIAIHILPNISRSKENQIMKFGQLTEYNMINVFLEKSFTKYGGTIPRPFPEKSKLNISLVQQSKVLYNLNFIVCHVEGYRNILKLICRPLASTSSKAFLRNKKMLQNKTKLVPCLIFCIDVKKKYISCYILLTDQI